MIKSMTAFARKQIQQDVGIMSWEIRSLNSRYLDINFHLPDVFRELEPEFRENVKKYLNRGKIDCLLRYHHGFVTHEEIEINKTWVNKVHAAAQQIKRVFGKKLTVNLVDILRWPGVMQIVQGDTSELHQSALNLFNTVLSELDDQRAREGEKLGQFIDQRLVEVHKEVQKVRERLPAILESQRERLLNRFNELNLEFDKARLEQEMVFMSQKMDVTEEIDRLDTHVNEVRKTLEMEGENGRRLDFLMQELNREANTLGSKSVSDVTSYSAVELKVLIEQMREQVQNIE